MSQLSKKGIMMTAGKTFLLSAIALSAFFGCRSAEESVAPKAKDNGAMSFRISMSANSTIKKIAKSALLSVTAPDMATINKELQINDSTIEGKVDNIPAGMDRKFLVRVFDSTQSECYRGSATGNIKGDSVTLVNLPISRIVGSAIINGTVNEGGVEVTSPFLKDSNTVFLADFNDNLTDFVSGENGASIGGKFAEAVFGKSIQYDSITYPKVGFRFPNSARVSITAGSLEALIKANQIGSGFMHIIDKSWLYGLTVFNGKVAVDFGKTWWYSNYSLPVQQWTYLCGSFDGRTIRLYANGALVDSSAYIPSEGDATWGLGIGNAFDNGFDIPFLGKIDEIRISKKARTDSEVKAAWKAIESKIP